MTKTKWLLNLQLFAGEGAGTGGGEGAATGDGGASAPAAVDAGQQRLLELGVPADKLRKRAQRSKAAAPAESAAKSAPKAEAQPMNEEQVAAAANPTEEKKTDTPARMSWKEIMEDPEYNKEMQAVVQSRLRSAKDAEATLAKIAPALEVLARKHGLDPANMDYEALEKAISNDNEYYEQKALEMGTSVETAKKIDQEERATAREQREQQRTLEQQKIRDHLIKLEQQGEAMKTAFPSFDLRKELQDPRFARMTSPNIGMSVEDAYYAIHRKEIQAAAMKATAENTAKKISNAIQSGSRRPDENGTSGQGASVSTFDYRNASKAQREALKQQIRAAAARGEKLYPGQK